MAAFRRIGYAQFCVSSLSKPPRTKPPKSAFWLHFARPNTPPRPQRSAEIAPRDGLIGLLGQARRIFPQPNGRGATYREHFRKLKPANCDTWGASPISPNRRGATLRELFSGSKNGRLRHIGSISRERAGKRRCDIYGAFSARAIYFYKITFHLLPRHRALRAFLSAPSRHPKPPSNRPKRAAARAEGRSREKPKRALCGRCARKRGDDLPHPCLRVGCARGSSFSQSIR